MAKKEFIQSLNRTSYEVIAREFDATRQQPWRELFEFGSLVKPGFCIADLGCGNGRLLKALPSVNFDYLGIDANEHLLARAREEFPERQFTQAELEAVALNPERYDIIFCIATFHHLANEYDRLNFLKKCRNALKPDGQLIMTNWNLWQGSYFFKYFFKNLHWKDTWNDMFVPWKTHTGETVLRYYHCFTKAELKRLVRAAGFQSVSTQKFLKEGGRGHNYTTIAVR